MSGDRLRNSQYYKSGHFEAYQEQRAQEKQRMYAIIAVGVVFVVAVTLFFVGGSGGGRATRNIPYEVAHACRNDCENTDLLCDIICKDFKDESPEISVWHAADYGGFSGVTGQFEESGSVIKEWYLAYGDALLYITYACDQEDDGLDGAAVDEILTTLVRGDSVAT